MGERGTAAPEMRRWWIAGLLNLVGGFGVGYLYVGRPARALIAVAYPILLLAILWHGLNGWLAEPWVGFAVAGSNLLLLAFAMDAMLIARRSNDFAPRWYNRWWVYVAVIVVTQTGASFVERSVQAFSVPSGSMVPTLRVGERFIVDKRAFDNRDPARGDLVVFKLPRDPEKQFIKRVVGLPGDAVQLQGGVLYINGKAVPTSEAGTFTLDPMRGWGDAKVKVAMKRELFANGRTILVLDSEQDGRFDNTEVFKVPPGHYFVLGDNRDRSIDSREPPHRYGVGYVPRENMLGVVSWIYWSPDWSRIGLRVY